MVVNVKCHAPVCLNIDGCDPEGEWPETSPGFTASVPCPCADIVGSLAGNMTRLCMGSYSRGAEWTNDVDDSQCASQRSGITGRLCNIAMVSSRPH